MKDKRAKYKKIFSHTFGLEVALCYYIAGKQGASDLACNTEENGGRSVNLWPNGKQK